MSSRIVAENIKLKRAYDSAGSGDGTRILIDRLWPRGGQKSRCCDRCVGQGHCS
jgi:uncharacterized protein YeaO (DUF488 family)